MAVYRLESFMMKLHSKRFFLRRLTALDATPQYLSWLEDPNITRFIVYKQNSINALKHYIQTQIDDDKTEFLGVFVEKSKQHIGNVKFIFEDDSFKCFEMGIMIGEADWHGKGVAGEVLSLFASYAKKEHNSEVMTLKVEENNKPAIRAYQKLGFEVVDVTIEPPGYVMEWDLVELL